MFPSLIFTLFLLCSIAVRCANAILSDATLCNLTHDLFSDRSVQDAFAARILPVLVNPTAADLPDGTVHCFVPPSFVNTSDFDAFFGGDNPDAPVIPSNSDTYPSPQPLSPTQEVQVCLFGCVRLLARVFTCASESHSPRDVLVVTKRNDPLCPSTPTPTPSPKPATTTLRSQVAFDQRLGAMSQRNSHKDQHTTIGDETLLQNAQSPRLKNSASQCHFKNMPRLPKYCVPSKPFGYLTRPTARQAENRVSVKHISDSSTLLTMTTLTTTDETKISRWTFGTSGAARGDNSMAEHANHNQQQQAWKYRLCKVVYNSLQRRYNAVRWGLSPSVVARLTNVRHIVPAAGSDVVPLSAISVRCLAPRRGNLKGIRSVSDVTPDNDFQLRPIKVGFRSELICGLGCRSRVFQYIPTGQIVQFLFTPDCVPAVFSACAGDTDVNVNLDNEQTGGLATASRLPIAPVFEVTNRNDDRRRIVRKAINTLRGQEGFSSISNSDILRTRVRHVNGVRYRVTLFLAQHIVEL